MPNKPTNPADQPEPKCPFPHGEAAGGGGAPPVPPMVIGAHDDGQPAAAAPGGPPRGCPMRHHGNHPHDIVPPRSKYFAAGRFGRIFGELPPFAADTPELRRALLEIGKQGGIMDARDQLSAGPKLLVTDANLQVDNTNNPKMGAGMTFLGQFLDHDMTFDPTSSLERQVDPEQIANFRTPSFGLDNVYGAGPGASPHLYDRLDEAKLYVEPIPGTSPQRFDVPRNAQQIALLGDPRNDENLIISQLQVAFLMFHNRVVDALRATGDYSAGEIFPEAQRLVRWHYQWIIIHEYLRLTCPRGMVEEILTNGRKFYDWQNEPFIPVEFSVACYRFGHSQVRPSYRANFTGGTGGSQLFQMIFKPVPDHTNPESDDLSGSWRAPWRFIDWQTFFNFGDPNFRPNKRIDTKLSSPLLELPGTVVANPDPASNPRSLATRNLLRHLTFSLPSGQRIAKAMKSKIPGLQELTADDLRDLKPYNLDTRTPLWFYVLREADVLAGGETLGPVGGRIVAEVFIGLLQGDPTSYLSLDADWKPTLPTLDPTRQGKDFSMVDLLTFAGVVPPIP